MNLKEVKIKNFRGYGENPYNEDGYYVFSDLDKNLVVLNGFNGNGKTSFFEAIEWCLTDTVARLDSFKNVYDLNTLKKCHYLKFYPLDSKESERNHRCISVELTFDNQVKIRRESFCNFLQVSDADDYVSNLSILDGNKKITLEEFLNRLVASNDALWQEQLVHTHFLGQETMNAFYRSKNPKTRRNILMQLLNLSKLEELYEYIDTLKKSRKFLTKPKQLQDSINSLTDKKKQINEIFKVRQWGDINEYVVKINNAYSNLCEKISVSIKDEFGITNLDKETLTLKNFRLIFKKLEVEKQRLNSLMQKTINDKGNLNIIKESADQLILLNKTLEKNRKVVQLKYLEETDISKLKINNGILVKNIESVKNKITQNEIRMQQLEKYQNLFEDLPKKGLNRKTKTISEDFWFYYTETFKSTKDFFLLANELQIDFEEHKKSYRTLIREANIHSLKKKYLVLNENRQSIGLLTKEKELELKNLTTLNEKYNEILLNVKQYIIANKSKISSCPICLNNNFTDSKYDVFIAVNDNVSNADIILNIIDSTISSDNPLIKEISSRLTILNEDSIQLEKDITEILTKMNSSLNNIRSLIKLVYESFMTVLTEKQDLLKADLKKFTTEQKSLSKQIDRFIESFKDNFGQELSDNFNRDEITKLLGTYQEELLGLFNEVKDKLNLSFIPTIEEVQDNIKKLSAIETLNDYYPNQLHLLDSEMKNFAKKVTGIQSLITELEKLLEYSLPKEYDDVFEDISNLDTRIDTESKKLIKINTFKGFINTVHENFNEIQKKIVEDILEKNPMINWIYESITPSPFYKSVTILHDNKKGTNTVSENGDIFLDQIFSTAQLNVLSLSIFLGLGLCQKFSNLNQLFMDDPIQSMDDVNILAFIDVLRAVMDSDLKHKKILMSTHDDNFAKLLSIKMRNKNFVQFNFTGYNNEGPLVRRVQ